MITYKGKEYKTRTLLFKGDVYTIAEASLNDLIMENFKDKELSDIDLGIVYYCDAEEMKLPDEELIKIVFDGVA